ncbi:MAG TPA: DUF6318 family protein [Actinomycetaceae bacterium]|nr:DUF6318 family protein [Actinomycetaceae bacterium]
MWGTRRPLPAGAVAVAVAVALALGGCSSVNIPGNWRRNETGTATTSEAPASGAVGTRERVTLPPFEQENPPVPPVATQNYDAAGAGEFVGYAMEVVNYSQRQLDGRLLRAISDEGCRFCQNSADGFDEMREARIRRVGGEIEFVVEAITYQRTNDIFFVDGTTYTAGFVDADLHGYVLSRVPEDSADVIFVVGLEGDEWRILDAGIRPAGTQPAETQPAS